MTRFFYPANRAHHAYSMAIDFGMEFEKRFGKWDRENLIHLAGATGYKLYVHPDSLHLFAPQRGDVMSQGESLFVFSPDIIKMGGFQHDAPPRIIQRNGIPFHFPDQEP